METPDLMILLDRFIDESDTSIEAANLLEVLIEDSFPDDDYLQETVEILACYRPQGGDFLFDTNQVLKRLLETRAYLKGLVTSHQHAGI